MRIPFFGRKPEPFTEGQIEYLRRYPVFAEALAHGGRQDRAVPLPTEPGLVVPAHARRAKANSTSNGMITPRRSTNANR